MVQQPVVQNGDSDVFGENDFIVTNKHIEEFRQRLQEEVKNDPDAYHPADLQKMWDSAELCRRYIRHKFLRVEDAVQMAKASLAWRKKFEVNDITEANVPKEWFALGAMFPLCKDKFGSQLIIYRVKLHRKNDRLSRQMKRFLVFWVEKILYEMECVRISFLFDCSGSGYANLDMEQIGFLIHLFKEYYPWALGFIFVCDMPWLFNTAWRVIKSWLPSEGVERIKFLDKNTISNYIDPENLPTYMGGQQKLPFLEYRHEDIDYLLKNAYNEQIIEERIPHTKAVRDFYRSRFNMFAPRSGDSNIAEGALIRIEPDFDLVFGIDETDGHKISASLTLINVSNNHVTFKIKTNNIDAYKVKPFFGIIPQKNSVNINVTQNPGSEFHLSDKLLIMTTGIDTLEFSPRELIDHWKKVAKDSIKEHRLRCVNHSGIEAELGVNSKEEQSTGIRHRSGTRKGGTKQPFQSFAAVKQRSSSQLETIHDTAAELQTRLGEVYSEVGVLSKRVDQIWMFTVVSFLVLVLNAVLLFMVKNCQTSSEWYC